QQLHERRRGRRRLPGGERGHGQRAEREPGGAEQRPTKQARARHFGPSEKALPAFPRHEPPVGRRAHRDAQRSFCTRSAGLTTSVNRMPYRSLMTTTSPCAISVPFTSTSSGSPASRSSSTTEP